MADLSLAHASFDRERHLPLLLEADDAEEHIRGYLDRGQLFEIRETDALIWVAVLVDDGDAVEIWNIASSEEHRGGGSGRRAIELIAGRCRDDGASRSIVGTADCSLGTIAFYRKVGFRFAAVRKGYFDVYPLPVVEDGIHARDMVMFEMELDPDSQTLPHRPVLGDPHGSNDP
ncbi:MAG: GNAT family N-acetyltransferase [Actinomycetota bacterium]|nr:GNAT family N-acetyltransferase [Actinomycetota bacterium]